MLGRHPITDGLCGAAFGLALASASRKTSSTGSYTALGGVLGVALGAFVRSSQGGKTFVGFTSSTFTGWSPPPHPIDVVASFDPRASKKEQARAILNSYLYDNDTRDWADDGTVKRAFGTAKKPIQKKEDFDPGLLIQAYENPQHAVWRTHGGRNSWKELDKVIRQAAARRTKLGPLPKSNYSPSNGDPVVIYYYDHDRMKKITYPLMSIPGALVPNNLFWWRWGLGDQSDASKKKGTDDIHTFETQDPKAIAAERAQPGLFGGSDHPNANRSGGQWHDEGFDAGKDIAGNVGVISGTTMQIIGAVLEVIPGIGTAIGTTLVMAAPYVQQIANVVDVSVAGGDNAVALAGISKMVVAAAAAGLKYGAGVDIPPVAVQAIGATIDQVSQSVDAAQKQKLDFEATWKKVAKKAASFGKLDDTAAHVIATVIGEDTFGKVFLAGHQAGKIADLPTVAAIAKFVQSMAAFQGDKISNFFLLGAGIGHITQVQEEQGVGTPTPVAHASAQAHAMPHGSHHAGFFYDPSLAQFGNAMSPFVQMPYAKAQQAMNLRPEDRYGPRLDAPNWYDWQGWW